MCKEIELPIIDTRGYEKIVKITREEAVSIIRFLADELE